MQVVYDIEVVFTNGERLVLSVLEGRDTYTPEPHLGRTTFILRPTPTTEEEILMPVEPRNICYQRIIRRELPDEVEVETREDQGRTRVAGKLPEVH